MIACSLGALEVDPFGTGIAVTDGKPDDFSQGSTFAERAVALWEALMREQDSEWSIRAHSLHCDRKQSGEFEAKQRNECKTKPAKLLAFLVCDH